MEMAKKIENDFKKALKERDTITVSTLRMLKAAMHNMEIEKKVRGLEDAQVIKIIMKQVQQHHDSIEQFNKGGRVDLVEKETKESEILKKYLPPQLSAQEITDVVKKIIAEVGAKGESDFGKVMKQVMSELKGKADGKVVNQIVSRLLKP